MLVKMPVKRNVEALSLRPHQAQKIRVILENTYISFYVQDRNLRELVKNCNNGRIKAYK